jgi:very-short-patch-repair endonuclease
VITTAQLMKCGCSKAMICRRVAQLRLFPKHRGVYAVGRPDLSPAGVCHAAALAVGEDAVVSHRAAGMLHGFWKRRIDVVEITVARRVRRRDGIRVYQAGLPRSDWRWREGMRVTTPERVLLDLAVTLRSERVFRRTVHEALVQEKVSEHTLRKAIQTHPGHKGSERLEAELADGAKPTRSGLEDWGVELLRGHPFPSFKTNVHPPGTPDWVEVDVIFPDHGLVIELDGTRYHDTPYRREQDAHKQELIEAAGLRVLRLTEEDAAPGNEAKTLEQIEDALT